jgi:hypothetical protein
MAHTVEIRAFVAHDDLVSILGKLLSNIGIHGCWGKGEIESGQEISEAPLSPVAF